VRFAGGGKKGRIDEARVNLNLQQSRELATDSRQERCQEGSSAHDG